MQESQLIEEIHNCKRCESIGGRKYVLLEGKKTPLDFGVSLKQFKIIFVVESPPVSGVYFWNLESKSRVRKRLLNQLVKAGLMKNQSLEEFKEEYYCTDAVKCPFQENKNQNANPPMKALENCRRFILREIQYCEPKIVCTLGKTPLKAFLKVKRFRLEDFAGKIVEESYLREDAKNLRCQFFSSWFPTPRAGIPENDKVQNMKILKDILKK
nr:uracil-DNA glycosylase family protein [Candidatus Freyarchaeota archaeon]